MSGVRHVPVPAKTASKCKASIDCPIWHSAVTGRAIWDVGLISRLCFGRPVYQQRRMGALNQVGTAVDRKMPFSPFVFPIVGLPE